MNTIHENTHIPTLNSMGYMTKILDPFCEEFIRSAKNAKYPIVDIGVAFGHTTRKLLEQGAFVYANDIANEHLEYLANDVAIEERARLKLLPGKMPEVFHFEDNSLSGVLAARCFHFLTGQEIESLTQKVYNSLVPGGTFCIVAETPYCKHTASFIETFEERKASGDKWPGYIEDFKKYTNRANTTSWINLLDPDVLERTFKQIGFKVQKLCFIPRPYFPEEVRLNGKESVGILGMK